MNECQCNNCKFLTIIPGDWVPYGSTNAQLPDEYECTYEWPEGNAENDYCNMVVRHV